MNNYPSTAEQGAAHRPPLLDLQRIVALTDAAQALFKDLYDFERAARRASKARLRAELDELDLTGLAVNRNDSAAREHQPDEERDWCP